MLLERDAKRKAMAAGVFFWTSRRGHGCPCAGSRNKSRRVRFWICAARVWSGAEAEPDSNICDDPGSLSVDHHMCTKESGQCARCVAQFRWCTDRVVSAQFGKTRFKAHVLQSRAADVAGTTHLWWPRAVKKPVRKACLWERREGRGVR